MADTSVSKFMDVTGADASTASFFLSAAAGNVDAAISSFFESDGVVPSGVAAPTPTPRPAPRRPAAGPSNPARAPRSTGGIRTLGSLKSDNEEENGEPNSYYAGGEKSGQVVQDPKKKNGEEEESEPDLTESIFERARQRGPRTDEERAQFEGDQAFTGAGYRLGDTQNQRRRTPDVVGRRNVTRELTFYENGFTVDDGPLRLFNDPENEAFLSDVNRGVVPREMEEPGIGDVSITLIDKKKETYVPPKKKIVPFSGGGQRLGAQASASSAAPPQAPNVQQAAAAVSIDESRPVASVQVRLSDGTRLVARLNEDSTVGDLRAFVRASRPGNAQFRLSTQFPRKVLDDDSKTIKDAQLKGAVVMQTMI